jgi:hypothetical protein
MSQRTRIIKAVESLSLNYGNLSGPQWESISVRRVHVTSISSLPRNGTQGVLNVTGEATLTVAPASNSDGLQPDQQFIVGPHGTTVQQRVRIQASIARRSHDAWTVVRVFNVSPLPLSASVTRDPSLTSVVLHLVRALFSYNGNATVYAQDQRQIYATSPAAGNRGPPTPLLPGAALVGAPCPGEFLLAIGDDPAAGYLFPAQMRPIHVRLTRIRPLYGLPPTVRVTGRITVAASGWNGPLAARVPAACRPATSTLSFSTVMVRSLTSGRWLVAQLNTYGSPRGVPQSAVYKGLDSW